MFNPLTYMGVVSIHPPPGTVDLGPVLVNRVTQTNTYRVMDKSLNVPVFEGKLGQTRKFLKGMGLKL